MNITERLEQLTLNLLTAQFYEVEEEPTTCALCEDAPVEISDLCFSCAQYQYE